MCGDDTDSRNLATLEEKHREVAARKADGVAFVLYKPLLLRTSAA